MRGAAGHGQCQAAPGGPGVLGTVARRALGLPHLVAHTKPQVPVVLPAAITSPRAGVALGHPGEPWVFGLFGAVGVAIEVCRIEARCWTVGFGV